MWLCPCMYASTCMSVVIYKRQTLAKGSPLHKRLPDTFWTCCALHGWARLDYQIRYIRQHVTECNGKAMTVFVHHAGFRIKAITIPPKIYSLFYYITIIINQSLILSSLIIFNRLRYRLLFLLDSVLSV